MYGIPKLILTRLIVSNQKSVKISLTYSYASSIANVKTIIYNYTLTREINLIDNQTVKFFMKHLTFCLRKRYYICIMKLTPKEIIDVQVKLVKEKKTKKSLAKEVGCSPSQLSLFLKDGPCPTHHYLNIMKFLKKVKP